MKHKLKEKAEGLTTTAVEKITIVGRYFLPDFVQNLKVFENLLIWI